MIFPSICLVTAFVMSTWFVDNLAVALYLWICGPPDDITAVALSLSARRVDRGNYSVGGVLTAGIAAAHAAARRAAIQRHAAFLRT